MMEYYLAIKRNGTGSFVETWMDLEPVIQSEVSQKEKKYIYKVAYMWNLKKVVQMNAEFQRRARKDNKALSEQCKETEEHNKMGKTRDLLKEIRDTKRTVHAKSGTIKDRNGMNLAEAEKIKERWQEYTSTVQKSLNNSDNHNGVVSHLKPDILDCELK